MVLSKEQISRRIKEYKAESKLKGFDTVLSEDEISDLDSSLENIPDKYKEDFRLAQSNNYSKFNSLAPYLKNYLGAKKMQEFKQKCGENAPLNDVTKKFLEENAMDGAFRVAVSSYKHIDENANKYEVYMNEYLLVKTLTPPSEEEKRNVINRLGDEKEAEKVLNKNIEKQLIMAKTLFMAHLGKYDLKETETTSVEYKGSIAETIVHGGRTNFILPYGGYQAKMMKSYTGPDPKKNAGLEGRFAATHYSSSRKVNDDGTLKKDSIEEKPKRYEVNKIFSRQYGMNVAVGGIGSIGPDKKAILNDGTAGHMYIRKKIGDSKTCGSLLIGFESAATGKTSFTGHNHNMFAKSSKQSAFMADKFGQGIKTDGRTVDLSGLDSETFTQIMEQFDKCYREMQGQNSSKEKLAKFNALLSGNKMSVDQLKNSLIEIGMDKYLVERSVVRARKGLEGRNPVKEESIPVPNNKDMEEWAKSFSDVMKKANINLSTGRGLDRIKVAVKQDGKIVLNNLFDVKKQRDMVKCYQKLKASFDSNFSVYLYDAGKTYPKELKLNGLEVTTMDVKKNDYLIAPKKPNILKSIINKITFGRVFEDDFSKYEFEKEVYNQKLEKNNALNSYEKEREKTVKQEIAEIERFPVNGDRLKFDTELKNKIEEINASRVSNLSKNKGPSQATRK